MPACLLRRDARPLQKEPYDFSHLLFLSRVFLSSTAALEDDPNAALEQAIVAEAGLRSSQVAAPKKKKQRKGATKDERDDEKVWMYHPEDEFIQKVRVSAAEESCLAACLSVDD